MLMKLTPWRISKVQLLSFSNPNHQTNDAKQVDDGVGDFRNILCHSLKPEPDM